MKPCRAVLLAMMSVTAAASFADTDLKTIGTAATIIAGERLDDPIPTPIPRGSIRLRLKPIATGLTAPNWGTSIPGATEHLYISDQDRKIWRINLATQEKTLFYTLFHSDQVPLGIAGDDSYDERGLLGFAFHPQYIENGLFYIYDSRTAGDVSDFSTMPPGTIANHRSVVEEYRATSPSLYDLPAAIEREKVLLTVDQPQFNHNGGALIFGPDNMLYIALGDGGGADDRDGQPFLGGPIIGHGASGNGQNPANPLGSLLRIDPLGNDSRNGKYGIPENNPFVGSSTALPEIYAYGLRNPFRFSFDRLTGDLVLADVGQNAVEEINVIQAGGNYGWGLKEGSFRFEPNGNEPGYVTNGSIEGDFIDPIVQYDHDEGTAVIGGFVYRGAAIPELRGKYLFGDVAKTGNGDGRLFYTDGSSIQELDLTEQDQPGFWILGFGQDGDGELYVLGNTTGIPFGATGVVYKLIPNASLATDLLEIPAINVLSGDGSTAYRARLQLIPGSSPLRFAVIESEPLTDRFRDDSADYDETTGKLSLSFVNVPDENGKTFTYSAELQRVSELPSLTFELKQSQLVK